MKTVLPHIQYLLMHHDCVVIPGWGALVANYQSASISGSTILPPCRRIGFSPQITDYNDFLIVDSIKRREGVSQERAKMMLEKAVAQLSSLYEMNGEVTLQRIGSFRRNEQGTSMIFTPDESDNAVVASRYMALPALNMAPETAADTLGEEEQEVRTPVILRVGRYMRKPLKVAASVALLLVLGFTLTTPIPFSCDDTNFASLTTPATSLQKAEAAAAQANASMEDSARELLIAIPREEAPEIAVAHEATAPVDTPAKTATHASTAAAHRMVDTDRFYLIVASLDTRRSAQKYIDERPHEELQILERDGRYRVYTATGRSAQEARQLCADELFTAVHPDAWVYHK